MKALFTIALCSFCIACHAKFTAAVTQSGAPGPVYDVEQWSEANPPQPRGDGRVRVDCEEWVNYVPGALYTGSGFTMPDGSQPPEKLLDKIDDAKAKEFRSDLKAIRPELDDLKNGVGTNAVRIARLEKFVHLFFKILFWIVRTII